MEYIKGYQHHQVYRNSFDRLAGEVFGISFADWHAKGYWTEKYEPYSCIDGERVIANVSVNKLNLIIDGETKKAIQIGTVMTHPDYRGKGLSADLMNRVLTDYEGQYDIMYLFANHSVLEFYPKFGFRAVEEHLFTMTYTGGTGPGYIRKLDGHNQQDLQFIYRFAAERVPVSHILATANAAELLMFYCTAVFPKDIYYLKELDAIVLGRQIENELHVFDIISKQEITTGQVLQQLAPQDVDRAVLHFTGTEEMNKEVYRGSEVLFVKTKHVELPACFKHPLTSQA